eukprot:139223-Rhodomonas_salina.1
MPISSLQLRFGPPQHTFRERANVRQHSNSFLPALCQVGGYLSASKGYAGNTYLPHEQSPLSRDTHMILGGSVPGQSQLRLPHSAQSSDQMALLNLAPSDQVYIQSTGSQVLRATATPQMYSVATSVRHLDLRHLMSPPQCSEKRCVQPPQSTLVRIPTGYAVPASAPGTVPGSLMVSQPGLVGMTSFSSGATILNPKSCVLNSHRPTGQHLSAASCCVPLASEIASGMHVLRGETEACVSVPAMFQ